MCSIDSFTELLQTKEDEHSKIHAKHVLIMEAWKFESIKLDTMKWHKPTLCMQAQGMMNRHQCPTLMSLPLPLLCLESPYYLNFPCLLSILPCPFCQRLFEPTWDYKIASCKHTYHLWCAINHFSNSTKCLFEGCGQEMHLNWWAL
jgi:hypothetical protein